MASATVEIGHTYAPDRLLTIDNAGHPAISHVIPAYSDERIYKGEDIERFQNAAVRLQRERNIAHFLGRDTMLVALIDDVAARESQRKSPENSLRWQSFIDRSVRDTKYLTGARALYYESHFAQAGRDIVTQIQVMELPNGYRLSQDGSKLKLPKGVLADTNTIKLTGFMGVDDPTFPSCEVLDTAWLQKRLTMAPEAITILPSDMVGQQERAGIIADLVGVGRDAYSTVIYDQSI